MLTELVWQTKALPSLYIPMTDHVIPPEVVELYGSWMFEQKSRRRREKKSESSKITEAQKEVSMEKNSGVI